MLTENKTTAHVNNQNKVNSDKAEEKPKKEKLIIERDSEFVPVENWLENTQSQVNASKVSLWFKCCPVTQSKTSFKFTFYDKIRKLFVLKY